LHDALAVGLAQSADGQLVVSFEIVYGHAFKAAPRVSVAAQSSVSLDQMRSMLRSNKASS
jgi:malonyl-CoA O-methyltransferase